MRVWTSAARVRHVAASGGGRLPLMTSADLDPSSTGLDPNLAAALAYLGGALSGVAFLILERQSKFVRFHAMQSTMTFLGVLVLHLLFVSTPIIGWLLYPVFI